MSIHWEEVADYTYRLKIEGGYLYRYGYNRHSSSSTTLTFVPSLHTKEKKK